MTPKSKPKAEKDHASEKGVKPQDIDKSADPKQVGERGNIQQNTSNRRHQQQREAR
jgi:hypothetical protein